MCLLPSPQQIWQPLAAVLAHRFVDHPMSRFRVELQLQQGLLSCSWHDAGNAGGCSQTGCCMPVYHVHVLCQIECIQMSSICLRKHAGFHLWWTLSTQLWHNHLAWGKAMCAIVCAKR